MNNTYGLKRRQTYEEVVNFIETDPYKIVYPNRNAKFLRNSFELSFLDDKDYETMIEQQKKLNAQHITEEAIKKAAVDNGTSVIQERALGQYRYPENQEYYTSISPLRTASNILAGLFDRDTDNNDDDFQSLPDEEESANHRTEALMTRVREHLRDVSAQHEGALHIHPAAGVGDLSSTISSRAVEHFRLTPTPSIKPDTGKGYGDQTARETFNPTGRGQKKITQGKGYGDKIETKMVSGRGRKPVYTKEEWQERKLMDKENTLSKAVRRYEKRMDLKRERNAMKNEDSPEILQREIIAKKQEKKQRIEERNILNRDRNRKIEEAVKEIKFKAKQVKLKAKMVSSTAASSSSTGMMPGSGSRGAGSPFAGTV